MIGKPIDRNDEVVDRLSRLEAEIDELRSLLPRYWELHEAIQGLLGDSTTPGEEMTTSKGGPEVGHEKLGQQFRGVGSDNVKSGNDE
jgi:hypothetical protein